MNINILATVLEEIPRQSQQILMKHNYSCSFHFKCMFLCTNLLFIYVFISLCCFPPIDTLPRTSAEDRGSHP